ncbi:hypothetical protein TNCV_1366061 [Trichonephila clavipes]|nr:hypothetical protein TNCV_1366061 [Trichonephila clavipes]
MSTIPDVHKCCFIVKLEDATALIGFVALKKDLFIGLLCKAVSTSATFVFTMDALPDRIMSATDPVPRNCCTQSIIVDAFGAVSPGYFY